MDTRTIRSFESNSEEELKTYSSTIWCIDSALWQYRYSTGLYNYLLEDEPTRWTVEEINLTILKVSVALEEGIAGHELE